MALRQFQGHNIRGCTPESPKIPSENIMRVVPGCFCYPIRFSVHIWPLNQAVFGLAASLPENNCLASIRTSTGFPPMTEISGIPAYNPHYATEAVSRIFRPGFRYSKAEVLLMDICQPVNLPMIFS
ncbi:hypothetical protein ALO81_200347 [Pseudomonas cannabina]|uniref:Mobilization protein n=1 Tax=Pseudomonas cannabina TaxID=86840 RepID=A0A0P9QMB4_PSECA|nr:hypothetical protein ALO81_200347 [Pseudomonas cannabina]